MVWLAEQIKFAFIALMWFIAFCILMSALLWFVFSTWAERIFIFTIFGAILSIIVYFKHRNINVNDSSPTLGEVAKTSVNSQNKPVSEVGQESKQEVRQETTSKKDSHNYDRMLNFLKYQGNLDESLNFVSMPDSKWEEVFQYMKIGQSRNGQFEGIKIPESGNNLETFKEQNYG